MDLGTKLNLKPGMSVMVLDAPPDLDLNLGRDYSLTTEPGADAVFIFVREQALLGVRHDTLLEFTADDRLVWVAYSKGGKLGTDLSRDRLRNTLAEIRIRPVRQVSVDDVWSALRFRTA